MLIKLSTGKKMSKQYIILFVFLILYNIVINWLNKTEASRRVCFFLGSIFSLIYLLTLIMFDLLV